jgi:uncharacterized membrane protein YgaE (UPF0421/DUF939 family)
MSMVCLGLGVASIFVLLIHQFRLTEKRRRQTQREILRRELNEILQRMMSHDSEISEYDLHEMKRVLQQYRQL